MKDKELGDFAEALVCEDLHKNGYRIIERNYRVAFGEIDIVAQKRWWFFRKNPICFVEVKASFSDSTVFHPEDRVHRKKQHTLRRLAEAWLIQHHISLHYPYQIDVAGVVINPQTKKPTITYYEGALGE